MHRRRTAVLIAFAILSLAPLSCGRGGQPVAQSTTPVPTASATQPAATPTPVPSRSTATPAPRPTPSRTSSPRPFPPGLSGKDIERIPTDRPVVALTFDAGANADGVPAILATLAREHVPATFFLTGDFTLQFPDAVRSIARGGYRLANHSFSHPHFPTLTDAQIRAQLTDTEAAVGDVTGATTRPLFRFPYGDRTAHTIAVVNAQGYVAVRWTVDSLGWQGTSGGGSTASVTQRVLGAARPGEIVLMHVGSHPTDRSTLDADALPGIIAGLRQRGYTFVTLDALLTG
ncbi:MAG TPA: polysaccharide deacetylase family protein [Micromonosporaceae bacterium]|nr:polysaccharide deacetylase family protein [Micromonosporaceae bacterium]